MTSTRENAAGTAARPAPKGRVEAAMQSRSTIVLLAAITFAVCCARSFVPPHTPILFWGDALGYVTKGLRLATGELPYRDFFEFVTPGTDLVYAVLFRWLGASLWIPNLLMAVMAAMVTAWMTWCIRPLVQGAFVLLPGLLMAGFVLSGSLDATHRWFSTIAVLGAVSALFARTSAGRVVLAGAMCGLAASFTQSTGAAILTGLVGYLIWSSLQESAGSGACWRRVLLLCGAALLVFAAINGPFAIAAGVGRWIEDVVVYPMKYFGTVPINNWRGAGVEFVEKKGVLKWISLPWMYLAVPLTYTWFFLEMSRRKKAGAIDTKPSEPWNRLLLIAVAGVAMLASIAPALSIKRLSCASPPAMVLLPWLLSRRGRMGARTAGWLGAISVGIALAQIAVVQSRRMYPLDLPVGHTVTPQADDAEVYRWMARHTRPGQWYFGMPPLTFPLGLRNPAPIEAPGPGEYSRPEQIAAVVEGLERRKVPLLVLRPEIYVPHLLGYKVDHLQPFQDYLYRHYRKTKIFASGDEVWERTDIPQPDLMP